MQGEPKKTEYQPMTVISKGTFTLEEYLVMRNDMNVFHMAGCGIPSYCFCCLHNSVFPAGAIPGEEPSPYIHTEAQRLPGPSCNQEGKVDGLTLLAVTSSSVLSVLRHIRRLFPLC